VTIPHCALIYAIAALLIFGRSHALRLPAVQLRLPAVQIEQRHPHRIASAASIFLDVLNVLLLFLQIFGGES